MPTPVPNTPSPYPKLEARPRLLARLLDVAVALAMFAALRGAAGALLAALYLFVADALFQGQSPGKKCLGIKVVQIATRQGAGIWASMRRNALASLCALLTLIPVAGAWIALGAALILAIVEFISMRRHPLGMRLGDRLAVTQVIDGKDVQGSLVKFPSMLKADQASVDAQQAFATLPRRSLSGETSRHAA
ncbi:MAG: RDD family protein [Myxococcales bacterium]|nr:RDD family protein [Myxococcales bacterium]